MQGARLGSGDAFGLLVAGHAFRQIEPVVGVPFRRLFPPGLGDGMGRAFDLHVPRTSLHLSRTPVWGKARKTALLERAAASERGATAGMPGAALEAQPVQAAASRVRRTAKQVRTLFRRLCQAAPRRDVSTWTPHPRPARWRGRSPRPTDRYYSDVARCREREHHGPIRPTRRRSGPQRQPTSDNRTNAAVATWRIARPPSGHGCRRLMTLTGAPQRKIEHRRQPSPPYPMPRAAFIGRTAGFHGPRWLSHSGMASSTFGVLRGFDESCERRRRGRAALHESSYAGSVDHRACFLLYTCGQVSFPVPAISARLLRLFIGGDFNGDPLVDGLNVLAFDKMAGQRWALEVRNMGMDENRTKQLIQWAKSIPGEFSRRLKFLRGYRHVLKRRAAGPLTREGAL
ncbi:unnamed protein product [Symbiodinium microadriaticum]|nr:unnamed protein product [Symbiodinium microadriaticum]